MKTTAHNAKRSATASQLNDTGDAVDDVGGSHLLATAVAQPSARRHQKEDAQHQRKSKKPRKQQQQEPVPMMTTVSGRAASTTPTTIIGKTKRPRVFTIVFLLMPLLFFCLVVALIVSGSSSASSSSSSSTSGDDAFRLTPPLHQKSQNNDRSVSENHDATETVTTATTSKSVLLHGLAIVNTLSQSTAPTSCSPEANKRNDNTPSTAHLLPWRPSKCPENEAQWVAPWAVERGREAMEIAFGHGNDGHGDRSHSNSNTNSVNAIIGGMATRLRRVLLSSSSSSSSNPSPQQHAKAHDGDRGHYNDDSKKDWRRAMHCGNNSGNAEGDHQNSNNDNDCDRRRRALVRWFVIREMTTTKRNTRSLGKTRNTDNQQPSPPPPPSLLSSPPPLPRPQHHSHSSPQSSPSSPSSSSSSSFPSPSLLPSLLSRVVRLLTWRVVDVGANKGYAMTSMIETLLAPASSSSPSPTSWRAVRFYNRYYNNTSAGRHHDLANSDQDDDDEEEAKQGSDLHFSNRMTHRFIHETLLLRRGGRGAAAEDDRGTKSDFSDRLQVNPYSSQWLGAELFQQYHLSSSSSASSKVEGRRSSHQSAQEGEGEEARGEISKDTAKTFCGGCCECLSTAPSASAFGIIEQGLPSSPPLISPPVTKGMAPQSQENSKICFVSAADLTRQKMMVGALPTALRRREEEDTRKTRRFTLEETVDLISEYLFTHVVTPLIIDVSDDKHKTPPLQSSSSSSNSELPSLSPPPPSPTPFLCEHDPSHFRPAVLSLYGYEPSVSNYEWLTRFFRRGRRRMMRGGGGGGEFENKDNDQPPISPPYYYFADPSIGLEVNLYRMAVGNPKLSSHHQQPHHRDDDQVAVAERGGGGGGGGGGEDENGSRGAKYRRRKSNAATTSPLAGIDRRAAAAVAAVDDVRLVDFHEDLKLLKKRGVGKEDDSAVRGGESGKEKNERSENAKRVNVFVERENPAASSSRRQLFSAKQVQDRKSESTKSGSGEAFWYFYDDLEDPFLGTITTPDATTTMSSQKSNHGNDKNRRKVGGTAHGMMDYPTVLFPNVPLGSEVGSIVKDIGVSSMSSDDDVGNGGAKRAASPQYVPVRLISLDDHLLGVIVYHASTTTTNPIQSRHGGEEVREEERGKAVRLVRKLKDAMQEALFMRRLGGEGVNRVVGDDKKEDHRRQRQQRSLQRRPHAVFDHNTVGSAFVSIINEVEEDAFDDEDANKTEKSDKSSPSESNEIKIFSPSPIADPLPFFDHITTDAQGNDADVYKGARLLFSGWQRGEDEDGNDDGDDESEMDRFNNHRNRNSKTVHDKANDDGDFKALLRSGGHVSSYQLEMGAKAEYYTMFVEELGREHYEYHYHHHHYVHHAHHRSSKSNTNNRNRKMKERETQSSPPLSSSQSRHSHSNPHHNSGPLLPSYTYQCYFPTEAKRQGGPLVPTHVRINHEEYKKKKYIFEKENDGEEVRRTARNETKKGRGKSTDASLVSLRIREKHACWLKWYGAAAGWINALCVKRSYRYAFHHHSPHQSHSDRLDRRSREATEGGKGARTDLPSHPRPSPPFSSSPKQLSDIFDEIEGGGGMMMGGSRALTDEDHRQQKRERQPRLHNNVAGQCPSNAMQRKIIGSLLEQTKP